MKVAVGQFAPSDDRAANLGVIRGFACMAAEADAALLVVPEYSTWFRPDMADSAAEGADAVDGAVVADLRAIAARFGLGVVAGMLESATGAPSVPFNTLIAISPSGDLLTRYRKVHLYDVFGAGESGYLRRGAVEQQPLFDLEGLRFGLQTCFDLRFPEMGRRLLDAGADVIITPAQWVPGPGKQRHWETLLAARAMENVVYIVAAGQTAPHGTGHSMVFDPRGELLADAGTGPGVVLVDLSAAEVSSARSSNPSAELRRYGVVARDH